MQPNEKSNAWNEGYEYAKYNMGTYCPYSVLSIEYKEWQEGYDKAIEESHDGDDIPMELGHS